MAQAHTDAELLLATQIAYLDVDTYARRNSDPSNALTVEEILQRIESRYSGRENLTSHEQGQLNIVRDIRNMMRENNLDYCGNWRIIDYCNRNSQTGFYAVTIDTGFGDAVVGFRGSESAEDVVQAVNDWGRADAGLLNSIQTAQQKDAEDYIRHINETYYRGGNYQTISFTGHSLGGNLAEHAAITAPDDLRPKIDRATNWDGPGFSDEYIRVHTVNGDIQKAADKIDHYQWSVVSSLLNPIPGVNTVCIDSKEEPTDKKILGVLDDWRLQRHHTKNVILYNGDVKVIPREEADEYFKTIGPVSRVLENSPNIRLLKYIPVIGPIASAILFMNEAISIIRFTDSALRHFVDDFVNNLRETAIELRKRYRRSKVSGVYEVKPSGVRSSSDAIDRCGDRMKEISDQVRQIAWALPYDSVSGNYYRAKLLMISSQVSGDGRKADKCAGAGREAASYMEQAERNVCGKFS